MKPVNRDELAAALFRAARAERPSERQRARTLRAMRRNDRMPKRSGKDSLRAAAPFALAALAALAALVALAFKRDAAPTELSVSPEVVAPLVKTTTAASADPPAPPPARTARPRPTSTSRPVPRPPTLAEETAAINAIRTKLGQGDTRRALELLARYERGGNANRMRAEATLLHIEALVQSGKRDEARALARDFIAKNPGNPLLDRARALAEPDRSTKKEDEP